MKQRQEKTCCFLHNYFQELERLSSGRLKQIVLLPTSEGKVIYATDGTSVLRTATNQDLSSLAPCSHEETDTHLFLHALNAMQKGYRKLCVHTVDTDVVVLAISSFHQINAEELWLSFGTSSSFRYIPIHEASM